METQITAYVDLDNTLFDFQKTYYHYSKHVQLRDKYTYKQYVKAHKQYGYSVYNELNPTDTFQCLNDPEFWNSIDVNVATLLVCNTLCNTLGYQVKFVTHNVTPYSHKMKEQALDRVLMTPDVGLIETPNNKVEFLSQLSDEPFILVDDNYDMVLQAQADKHPNYFGTVFVDVYNIDFLNTFRNFQLINHLLSKHRILGAIHTKIDTESDVLMYNATIDALDELMQKHQINTQG